MEMQDAVGDLHLKGCTTKEMTLYPNTDENKTEDYATPTNTRIKDEQNLLKIVSVRTLPTHVDLCQKPTEHHNNWQEYTKQDTNLKVETERHVQHTEIYNNLQEYTEVKLTTSDTIAQEHIEVKKEINKELNPPYNIIQVKEEALCDLDNDISNVTNKTEENLSSKNIFDGNITIKDEFSKNILQIEQSFVRVDEISKNNNGVKDLKSNASINKALKGKQKVDGIPKKKKAVDFIMKNVTPSDIDSMFKCPVCYKAFLGNDAYKEHMKKHTTDKSPGNTTPSGGVVLKVGDPLSSKCTIVKVKRVKSKAKTKEEEYEEILAKYLETIKARSENEKNNDSAMGNSNSRKRYSNIAQNNRVEIDNSNVNIENKDSIEQPPKIEIKPIKKKRRRRRPLTMSVTYKKCDDNCTNDESCPKSKKCKKERKAKRDVNTIYLCKMCDYKCKYKKVLEKHMLTHTRVKSFRCHLCEYKCLQQSHLDQHIRIHTQIKPYSCNYCEYVCVQRCHLDQHIRIHTRVKPFTCNLCDYTCTQRCHLDQHMRIHTGFKPFSCTQCDYVCVQRAHLNNHIMKVHTNVHTFECKS